ncbi:MAG: hypothetical protein QOH91_928 [Mycobacterium sp.]|nr:hypothetical protein [Mycobacterium sp.]
MGMIGIGIYDGTVVEIRVTIDRLGARASQLQPQRISIRQGFIEKS